MSLEGSVRLTSIYSPGVPLHFWVPTIQERIPTIQERIPTAQESRCHSNNIEKCILYFPHRVEHLADNPVLRLSALPYRVLGFPELDLWHPRLFELPELPER